MNEVLIAIIICLFFKYNYYTVIYHAIATIVNTRTQMKKVVDKNCNKRIGYRTRNSSRSIKNVWTCRYRNESLLFNYFTFKPSSSFAVASVVVHIVDLSWTSKKCSSFIKSNHHSHASHLSDEEAF